MLTCSRCRTPIPGDSTFCPMCGRKAPGLDSFDTLRQELPSTLTEAAAQAASDSHFHVPRPRSADPVFTPTPELDIPREPVPEPPPRRTLVLAPADPMMMAPPQMASPVAPTMAIGAFPTAAGLHPPPVAYGPPQGPSPYAPRAPISGRFPAAGPVRIPITPSPARIAIGVVLAAVALWLALWFLPQYGDRASADVRTGIGIATGGLGLAAFALILTGVLYRAQAEVRCRVCARPVIAWKGAFGLHCPLGPHHARINWLVVVMTAVFWAALVAGGIGFLAWLS